MTNNQEEWKEKIKEILKGNIISSATKSELIDYIEIIIDSETAKAVEGERKRIGLILEIELDKSEKSILALLHPHAEG